MIYGDFGNTGVKISSLGFGCMRFPMVKFGEREVVDEDKVISMIQKAYEQGVNYFDSAYFYCQNLSEIALGKALKGIREKVNVSTKCPGGEKPGDYRRKLEEQLKKLNIDYVDFYHFHGIGYDSFFEMDKKIGWIKDAEKAKEEGLIKHISFSFHDKPENMIKLIDLGMFESVLCQYNLLDRSNEEAIAYAKSKGLGVAIMGPLGGGRISGMPASVAEKAGIKVKNGSEMALRFVLSNPNVDCALSGMNSMQMVEENTAVASKIDPLSEEELKAITNLMEENKKLSQLYCTGCNYCISCPSKVNIPYIFELMNYYRIYKIEEYAKSEYAQLGVAKWALEKLNASNCVECGACETKCPQKLPIMQRLKECHAALGK
jgi:uncharacterized protein